MQNIRVRAVPDTSSLTSKLQLVKPARIPLSKKISQKLICELIMQKF